MNKMDTNHPIDQEEKKEMKKRDTREVTPKFDQKFDRVIIKINHPFWWIRFSPQQHPRSIEFNETHDLSHHDPRPTEVHKGHTNIKCN